MACPARLRQGSDHVPHGEFFDRPGTRLPRAMKQRFEMLVRKPDQSGTAGSFPERAPSRCPLPFRRWEIGNILLRLPTGSPMPLYSQDNTLPAAGIAIRPVRAHPRDRQGDPRGEHL